MRFINIYSTYIQKIEIILILLIVNFFHYYKIKNVILTPLLIQNITKTNPIIHDYKLFNNTNSPFISIILDLSQLNLYLFNDRLNYFLLEISKSIFLDIQILILYDSTLELLPNITKKLFLKNNNIQFLSIITTDWIKSFFSLLKVIKGKFFVLLNNIINIRVDDFHKILNITKGSKENIFKLEFLKNENDNNIYLIRTKILKDIIDSEINFKSFRDIINYIYEQPIHKFNYIPIIFCPDNYYTSLTYTSMISILITKGYYTYILFYLVIPLNFSLRNIKFFETLYEQFDYFNISFIQMDNRYKNAYTNRYITKNAFYRLSLGELLPYLDKVIYLDSDTISLKDLTNLYNLNFMGKIFLAKINTFISNDNYLVNTGVLLLNLKGMRKIKVEEKTLTVLKEGFKEPFFHDQAIINKFFKKYIGFLPPEYNTYTFSLKKLEDYKKDSGHLYDFDSLYFSFKFPAIIHYRGEPKIKTYEEEDWYYFARQSKYFQKRSKNISEIFKMPL